MSDSRLHASASSSRPFLNLLNPMGRHYRGYTPMSRERVDEDDEDDEDDRGARDRPARRVSFGAHDDRARDRDDSGSSDGEVPQSFMIEATPSQPAVRAPPPKTKRASARRQQQQQQQQPILPTSATPVHAASSPKQGMRGLDERERALWNWVNVYNLDAYLQEVYAYYEGKGIYCIALARALNLLTIGFVITFSTFLLGCVDYPRLRHEGTKHLSDVVVDRCVSRFSGFTWLFFLSFTTFFVWQIVKFGLDMVSLLNMHRFFTYLLQVPEVDIQTISWPEIVRRIGAIRESNPLTAVASNSGDPDYSPPTAKLDAHDIANRIMRQENYLIALFNKEVLDFRIPLPPFLAARLRPDDNKKSTLLTKALEWNLRFCLLGYLFDHEGRVRKVFLKEKNRKVLVEQLKRRFIFMGLLNALFVPFIVLYLVMYSFFRYFEEYRNNPSSFSGRKYTAYAEWKFREFNELPHLFSRRLSLSYPIANVYINQFPKEQVALVMRFIAFVAGSFAAVLLLASIADPDLFLNFEITPHRTVLFYLGVCGSVLAVARGMVPEKNRVFDPEVLMRDVIRYTHYMPVEWKGMLHSQKTHEEFGALFDMKVKIFALEVLSVLATPFILWYSLPPCAPAIVDFFREFTVHIDGLGYVCSFAEFNFKRHGNVQFGAPSEATDERLMSKEGKMEKSFLNFKAANPDWNPSDPAGSLYLSRLADLNTTMNVAASTKRSNSRGRKLDSGDMVFGYGHGYPYAPGASHVMPRSMVDRAQEYDRALQQSMSAAAARRRQAQRVPDMLASEQTDLQPSVHHPHLSPIQTVDRAQDGGVGSELGDSYVDDVQTRGGQLADRGVAEQSLYPEQERQELEELADGGVVGLLTQIYGRQKVL
ncbi:APG9-domain-containing protein [Exidia glandulosa HHB12029]|uniref:Autophagy-related protein 9 n=1 Tax=Exidia glandulosa HHB12029 TaxID=1314781 RepID=A0A165ENZ9_EXIGL|nr:APG9-domain-containing protein [Exidia glandulosa HHB12029]